MYDPYLDDEKFVRTISPTYGELWYIFKLKCAVILWNKFKFIRDLKAIFASTIFALKDIQNFDKRMKSQMSYYEVLEYMSDLEVESIKLRIHNIIKYRRVW